jgi:hypothetical protein
MALALPCRALNAVTKLMGLLTRWHHGPWRLVCRSLGCQKQRPQCSAGLPAEMSSQAGIALQAQQVKSAILFQAINLLVKLVVHHEGFIPSASSRECGCATAFSSHARTCCSSNTRKPMQRSSTCLTNTTASTYFHASQSTVSYIIQTHLSAAVRRLTADSHKHRGRRRTCSCNIHSSSHLLSHYALRPQSLTSTVKRA